MGDPQNDSKWDWHQCGSNRKKTCCFSSQIFTFFWEKMRIRPQENFGWKSEKKTRSKKKCPFCSRSFWRLLDVQYYFGVLFRYKYWCLESLEYVRPLYTCYGRPLFQKVPNILPKNAQNRSWGTLSEAKCCSLMVQQFFFLNKFYMHELHSAKRVSRRNSFRPK